MAPLTRNKKLKLTITYQEEVLFNSDTLSKIISYLPSVDLLSLAVTCRRLGVSDHNDQSLIEKSTHIAVQDIATEEELGTLPYYNGENSLANYHYLQLMRGPLTFDQLVGPAEYTNSGDKSCVCNNTQYCWTSAFSDKILWAGQHYVSFQLYSELHASYMLGVMRPGQANQKARGVPTMRSFYRNFSQRLGGEHTNNNIHCCLYNSYDAHCILSEWADRSNKVERWDGMEGMSSDGKIGMLLDLEEGTLSVYKNGQKLGVMKRGLTGPYCWVASLYQGAQVTIEQGTMPPSLDEK